MASLRSLAYAVTLLAGTSLLAATPGNATTDSYVDVSTACDLAKVHTLLATSTDADGKRANEAAALITASFAGCLDVVRALLAANADVNARRLDGATALIMASQNDQVAVVRALLPRMPT